MALLGNYTVLTKSAGRNFSGTVLAQFRSEFQKAGALRGQFTATGREPKSGVPDGYRPGNALVIPIKGGALRSSNVIQGLGALAGAGALGRNMEATLAGSGALAAIGDLIVSMVASLSGSGTISSAAVDGFLQMAASLAGSGDLAGAIQALGNAQAALSGAGTAAATINATGSLAASITATGDVLTSSNVGAAVWRYLVEAGFSAEEILRIVAAAAAGEASGNPAGPVQFVGLDGTTVRIESDVDADGNRSNITLDGA